MPEQSLVKILTDSIAYAEREIKKCEQELAGKKEVGIYHRNFFVYLAGSIEISSYYLVKEDSSLQPLADRAQKILKKRNQECDMIYRKYLDISVMIATFEKSEKDFCEMYVNRLLAGKMITAEMVMNYMFSLLSISNEHPELKAIKKIDEEVYASEFRMKSAREEMDVYRDYVVVCKKKLETLTS